MFGAGAVYATLFAQGRTAHVHASSELEESR